MNQEHWCEHLSHSFFVEDPKDVRRVKARYHEGEITVCPECFETLTQQGVYDPSGNWLRRARKAAQDIGWQDTPFTDMDEVLALASVTTGKPPQRVEQPGFVAYMVGEWLIAQADTGGVVRQLDLSHSTAAKPTRRKGKPRPSPRTRRVRVVSPMVRVRRHGIMIDPIVTLEDATKELYALVANQAYYDEFKGTFVCLQGGDGKRRSWIFEVNGELFSMMECNALYPKGVQFKDLPLDVWQRTPKQEKQDASNTEPF